MNHLSATKLLGHGLIVSCQAPADSPLHDPEVIAAMAQAAVNQGAVAVRIDTPAHVSAVRQRVKVPIIGLWKQQLPGFEVYITPQFDHAAAIAAAGADIIAIDATLRERPGGETLAELIARIHKELGKPVMADVDTIESAIAAAAAGADLVGTTLYGYTKETQHLSPPGLELLVQMVEKLEVPVICEGGISSPQMAKHALELGAYAVVVGTAITGIDAQVKAYQQTLLTARGSNIQKLIELFQQQTPNVIPEIAPNDGMFIKGRERHYFSVGQSALRCIKLAMLSAGKEDFKKILDLPCGHGRVLRVLKAAFPKAEITACDLDRDGVDFCVKALGATGVYSVEQPDKIPLERDFDLIWCGSLLTHLDSKHWFDWLNFFNSHLCPGGIVVFTVCGSYIVHRIRIGEYDYGLDRQQLPILLKDYEKTGFGYLDYPNWKNYGLSVSSPSWVLSQIEKFPQLRLLTYTERGWDNHQDVIACLRVPD